MVEIVNFSKYKLIPMEELVKAEWNYKQEDEEMATALVENFKRNGQVENLIVRQLDTGYYEVVNGNHRYDALKVLGAKKVVVYDKGKISLTEAQRLAVETNESKFVADQVELAKLLKEMTDTFDEDELLATLPYSKQELDNMVSMTEFDFNKLGGGSSGEEGVAGNTNPNALKLTLNEDVLLLWKEWIETVRRLTGDANEYKAFALGMETLAVIDEDTVPFTTVSTDSNTTTTRKEGKE